MDKREPLLTGFVDASYEGALPFEIYRVDGVEDQFDIWVSGNFVDQTDGTIRDFCDNYGYRGAQTIDDFGRGLTFDIEEEVNRAE